MPNARVPQILQQVTSLAAPGSWLGFDIVNAVTLTCPLTRPWGARRPKLALAVMRFLAFGGSHHGHHHPIRPLHFGRHA